MAAGGRECSSPGRDLSETPQGFLAALTNSQDRWPHTGQLRISSLKSRRCDCIPGWAGQVRSCRAWGRDVAAASSPPVCVARPAPQHTRKSLQGAKFIGSRMPPKTHPSGQQGSWSQHGRLSSRQHR